MITCLTLARWWACRVSTLVWSSASQYRDRRLSSWALFSSGLPRTLEGYFAQSLDAAGIAPQEKATQVVSGTGMRNNTCKIMTRTEVWCRNTRRRILPSKALLSDYQQAYTLFRRFASDTIPVGAVGLKRLPAR